jgi:thiol-disulfide isomerase/thioredoxin
MTHEGALARSGIDRIATTTEQGDVELTRAFEDAVTEHAEAIGPLDERGLDDYLRSRLANERADRFRDRCRNDPELLARYLALADTLGDKTDDERYQLLLALDYFYRDPPADHGSPDGYQPVYGDRLPLFLDIAPAAIVYVWRDECAPCDLMRADLETFVGTLPDHVGLYSVYGPDDAAVLAEEYGVTGGPTTLFCKDGVVDCRLVGSRTPEVIAHEIAHIT